MIDVQILPENKQMELVWVRYDPTSTNMNANVQLDCLHVRFPYVVATIKIHTDLARCQNAVCRGAAFFLDGRTAKFLYLLTFAC